MDDIKLASIIDTLKSRCTNIVQLAARVRNRLDPTTIRYDDTAVAFIDKIGDMWIANIVYAYEILSSVTVWTDDVLLAALLDNAESYGVARKEFVQSIRILLTGYTVSEPIEQVLCNIGKDATLNRCKTAIDMYFHT
jgi:glutamyl-tRNA synthetase